MFQGDFLVPSNERLPLKQYTDRTLNFKQFGPSNSEWLLALNDSNGKRKKFFGLEHFY